MSRLVIRLDVDSPEESSLLSAATATCLASAGLPTAQRSDAPDAIVSMRVAVEPSLRVAEGLFVARGTLSASVHRPTENAAIAGSDAKVKGGGADAVGAQHDALRRLAVESVPGALNQLFAQLHWDWVRPCGGGAR